ncbi:C-C motif chemokine 24-like [Dryobates pubescens]|uniref:C-C motif chemokine 24-like n=1 Tax=Dryobates pubescens TaxID=118200 RepID=UPI0023B905B9|nr:C-C motif chemokine 24-like [Dryobates pubescens]
MRAASLRVLLALKLLCLVTLAGGQPKASLMCSRECQKFSPKIEAKRIRSYHSTEATCKTKAIILVTLRMLQICADPEADWVKKIMKELDREKASPSPLPQAAGPAEGPGGVQSSQLPLVIPAAVVSALMVCGVAVAWLYLKFGLRREEVAREMVQGLLYQKAAPAPDAYPMEEV